MARRYRNDDSEDLAKIILIGIFLFALYLFGLWKSDRIHFWLWVIIGLMVVAVIGIVLILWSDFKSKKRKRLFAAVLQTGTDKDIHNFINSFGQVKKAEKNIWREGEYSFTWQQLDTLRRVLREKGVPVSVNNYKDISLLLRHYIYSKDDNFVRESLKHQNHSFSSINDSQFEDLLRRLYEAMGYSVERTGRTGDQGCDLVVNMVNQRAVIQAKQWNTPVGNKAVQEANGALGLYNCTKVYVVTNSSFTPEAIQLAKADNVGLVDGQRLRELLLEFLKENWS